LILIRLYSSRFTHSTVYSPHATMRRLPILYAFLPHGFHLLAALILGVTAGFCEEVLFRALLMTQFAKAVYGRAIEVLIPGLAFGLAHAGYLNQGFLVWLGIVLPTAFLGIMWGVAYLLGRHSLLPTICRSLF
jgi:membrane protease YdiL (CAAX protease family)